MVNPSDSVSDLRLTEIFNLREIQIREKYNLCEISLMIISIFLCILTFPLSLFFSLKIIQEYQRAVIFRLGRLPTRHARGPGLIFVLPCLDVSVIADLRTQTFNIPPQELLTRDSVTILVDAVVNVTIVDPTASIVRVEDAQFSTKFIAATALRNVFGTKSLKNILSDREALADMLKEEIDDVTINWGISVDRVEVKDVCLPVHMQRIMAIEAEATRDSKAKLIAAEGEKTASYALKEASDIISSSPMAIQLRYMQTLNSISQEQESTILFPIPIDFNVASGSKGDEVEHLSAQRKI